MKVAVVTQYFPNSGAPWGGHSAYQTLRELAKKVELQVFSPVLTYPKMLKPKSQLGAKAVDFAWRPPGVAVTYVEWPLLPLVSRPLNGFVITRQLLPHVRAFGPDVVLNYIAYPDGYAAVRMARRLGVPAVLTAIGSDLNRIPDPLVGWLTGYALRHADLVTDGERGPEQDGEEAGGDERSGDFEWMRYEGVSSAGSVCGEGGAGGGCGRGGGGLCGAAGCAEGLDRID